MSLLRKYHGGATVVSSNRHEFGDKNEHNNKTVDLTSDSEQIECNNLRDPINEYMVKMLNVIREFVIFCLVFIAYAAITNDPPKVSRAPAAYPFFPKDSLVKDFYRGQIVSAVEHARTTDISFIMFYAPWDAESQTARKEFLIAAEYMKDHVIFTAVNCWQPGSDCRNQYSKVYRWPVLIVYPSVGTGIQYNGPIKAPHMISFLQKLMRPVKKINESNINFDEAFIVAELNTLPGSVEYSVYYSTALKYLEADYFGRVSFYVKPVKYSQDKITLYLWNQARILDIEPANWKVETILRWIMKTCESPSSWVSPSGSKSLQLSDSLQPGPSLILFTPRNPLHPLTDFYMMLQEIAQEYKNCDNWGLNFDMHTKRLRNYQEYKRLKSSCYLKQTFPRPKKVSSVTMATPFLNSSGSINRNLGDKVELDCNTLSIGARMTQMCQALKMGKCFDVLPPPLSSIGPEDHKFAKNERGVRESIEESLEDHPAIYETSMWRHDSDPRSSQNLKKSLQNERCKTFLAAEKLHPAIFVPYDQNSAPIDISNLSCLNSNQSLNIIAMDSLIYYVFAERLGIDLSERKDRSAAVILNERMETHYIMQEPITSKNLRLFIRNFTNSTLPRSLDSNVDVPSKNSPSYQLKDSDNTFKEGDESSGPMIYVEELNGKNFLETVLEEKKAVLVMYYSKQCSYCNGISYVFLTVARKLSFIDSIKFTRIDGEQNILPWEYTMDDFPTILFFPANRKEETRVFPADIPITVPNLLGFILSNVDRPLKLHVMYSVCLHSQRKKDKTSCLAAVRNETIVLIDKTLKDWRKSNNRQRQLVLHNLKQLRQLQFLFGHSPDEFSTIDNYFKKLKVQKNYDYLTSSNSVNTARDEL